MVAPANPTAFAPASAAISTQPTGAATSASAAAGTEKLQKVAQDFESVFLAQMLASMRQGLSGDNPMGDSESPFGAMLAEEQAKVISRSGGIGVGDAILQELLKLQEVE